MSLQHLLPAFNYQIPHKYSRNMALLSHMWYVTLTTGAMCYCLTLFPLSDTSTCESAAKEWECAQQHGRYCTRILWHSELWWQPNLLQVGLALSQPNLQQVGLAGCQKLNSVTTLESVCFIYPFLSLSTRTLQGILIARFNWHSFSKV